MSSMNGGGARLTAKQQRKLALASLKSARSGRLSSALDEICDDDKNNGDVYDVMDEEEYRDYVERRREREDFVVDDDGLGYHDDGDYDILGLKDDDHHPGKAKGGNGGSGGNALTREALKRARKNKMISSSSSSSSLGAGASGVGGATGGSNNRTMWDFLNRGVAASSSSSSSSSANNAAPDVHFRNHHPAIAAHGKGGVERGNARGGRGIGGGGGGGVSDEIDDLLEGLDDHDDDLRGRGRRGGGGGGRGGPSGGRGRRYVGASSSSSRKRAAPPGHNQRRVDRGGDGGGGRPSFSSSSSSKRRGESVEGRRIERDRDNDKDHDDNDYGYEEERVDFGGDDYHQDMDFDDDNVVRINDGGESTMGGASERSDEAAIDKEEITTDADAAVVGHDENDGRRQQRPGRLAGRLAAASRAKEEEEEEKKRQAAEAVAAHKAEAERRKDMAAASLVSDAKFGGIAMDMNSVSFRSVSIPAAGGHDDDTPGISAIGGGVGGNLDTIIQMEEVPVGGEPMEVDGKEGTEESAKEDGGAARPCPRSYIDLFWLDASERNGVVSLYGKVAVPIVDAGSRDKKTNDGGQRFVYQSCCVTIPNNERNLFVLPRLIPVAADAVTGEDGTSNEDDEEAGEREQRERQRHPILDVYAELKAVLQPSCIPHAQGANWKAKPVTRSYAFEDASIPREPCQYLKVVYDGKFPVPERDVCVQGGKTFEKILGAGASNLENFLIKRRLMGPGWVRVYDPKPAVNVSWCKWECVIDGPKSLKRVDLVATNDGSGGRIAAPPPPPVSAVSVKFKTVVNPKSHKLEIVCVSAICHSKVMIEGSTASEGSRNMTALTLVRPLGLDAGNGGAMAQFPRDMEKECRASMPELGKCPNERALLSRLFAQLGTWDPDVIVSHNGWGHDIDLLLSRCVELKVSMWSKIGRRRQMRLPSASQFGNGKDWAIAGALDGRLLCDTYISAKEFLSKETTYSLVNLAKTQLKVEHEEIESVDVPHWCRTGEHFVCLAKNTQREAHLVQSLMFKLQVLPLTKQLTNIAGNLWAHTMKGNRAERNEYLLLHEFHQLKYLVPEKRNAKQRNEELFGAEEGGGATAGSNNKAKYSGGLVLEPKKGLYDSFILLLDFNSLYPSLIQEYNLCFTTVDWAKSTPSSNAHEGGQGDVLPPLPDESLDRGVLPRVIKTLVDRRRNVKKFMTNEKDVDKKEELNIRQMALKLTANSMYGCLGFSNSRFYAQPIAALVTAMGRDTLQRTVDLAQTTIGLEVIYGDTDSIMINTRITDVNEYSKVLELGNTVKREVNKLYKTLELEVDGVFRSMLLLKKKKYAAVTISTGPNGQFLMGKETKGLDLVRRDWCIQSKESGLYILDQILSGDEKETVVNNIHDHLEKVAALMRGGELPLDKYVITKGLNKHPNDYPDAKSQAHVYVAKRMINNHKAVGVGDHIPYVITAPTDEDGQQQQQASAKKELISERARHPDEINRSNGVLKPDVEWYLVNQILPPITRLCEPIEGTSPGILAEKLGLDSSRYHGVSSTNVDEDDIVDFTPASCLPDEERFKGAEKLFLTCRGCGDEGEFPGICRLAKDSDAGTSHRVSGLRCPNPRCRNPDYWGMGDRRSCTAGIINKMNSIKKKHQRLYYDGWVRCDDPMCNLETRQLSVFEGCCLKQGCNGRMKSVYTESALQTQLKYFDSLFDVTHAIKQQRRSARSPAQDSISIEKEIKEITLDVGDEDMKAFQVLHGFSSQSLSKSGYNWVGAKFFQTLFGANRQ